MVDHTGEQEEDGLGAAFAAERQLLEEGIANSGFRREGRFKLLRFELGDAGAAAVFDYQGNGTETHHGLQVQNKEIKLELDPLRLLVQEMAPGSERRYLALVEFALTDFSWVQWSVQDSAESLRPASEFAVIGDNMASMMDTLYALREGVSQPVDPAPGENFGPKF